MEFHALPLVPDVAAALAGFATLAGVIKHNEMESDAIFDVVLYSVIALVFSLLAIAFEATSGPALRNISLILAIVSSIALVREAKVFRAAIRNPGNMDSTGAAFGYASPVFILLSPLLALVVAFDSSSAHAALIYELSILSHMAVALIMLLYVVWRNFALRLHEFSRDRDEG